ncbi:MAG: heparan-alpha-glucosaminide N-acetyltransferase domain-containing protein [Duganella sp.]
MTEQRKARVASIDVMRGLVMMIMMLDHVRETFFLRWQVSDPMDVATVDPALFFSRFAAHFCAPMFVFLTGLSAWLYAHPASGPRSATGFLLKRGLFLVVLEVLVVSVAWTGVFPPPTIYLQVIWVIGLAMIALALLHRLPRAVLAALGLAIVFGHNLLTPIAFAPDSWGYVPWTILHDRGFLVAQGAMKIKVSYPLLPWIGVIVLGYVAGPWYARTTASAQRRSLLIGTGAAALALLLVLRGLNLYGETLDWVHGDSALRTVMSFLNVTKYPPSLAFLLLTLGAGLLVLGWLEQREHRFLQVCASFGGAPMFYYLLHLFVLLGLQKLAVALLGANYGNRYEFDSLWMVWLLSAVLIPLLYWPCKVFGAFKRRTSMGWVRYL